MAFNQHLADRIRQRLKLKNVTAKEMKMMGGLCFMVNGKMCLGVSGDELMARVGPEAYEKSLERKGCRVMDFTGRPLKAFVFVDSSGIDTARALDAWIQRCLDYNPYAKASPKRKK